MSNTDKYLNNGIFKLKTKTKDGKVGWMRSKNKQYWL